MAAGFLKLSQVVANRGEISPKPLRVFCAMLPYFVNNWIYHGSPPKNSFGDTISGQI